MNHSGRASASSDGDASDHDRADQVLALTAGQSRRRVSRERLLAAATTEFCERGYFTASVEDIANAAGLSRMTFYRHFPSKADLAAELFEEVAVRGTPRLLGIASHPHPNRGAVLRWLRQIFEADQANRLLLRVFIQARSDENLFADRGHQWIGSLINRLGQTMPAFALDANSPSDRRRWLEAWLLIYEILDQSNHAALSSGVATDPLVLEILADRFVAFLNP